MKLQLVFINFIKKIIAALLSAIKNGGQEHGPASYKVFQMSLA